MYWALCTLGPARCTWNGCVDHPVEWRGLSGRHLQYLMTNDWRAAYVRWGRPLSALSARAYRPRECVSVETLFVVKLLEKCTGPQRNAERTPSRAAEA